LPDIVLTTINARYTHASLGLRYLQANLGDLRERSTILEFVLGARTEDMLERILAASARIVGIGVYIWNVDEATRLAQQLRALAPQVKIVLGGPEVSHEHQGQPIVAIADHVISGPADLSFATLCRQLLDGPRPLQKLIAGDQPDLSALRLPYDLYSDEDIAHRHLYVEASRGCPFRCEFCLSSLDKTAWPFDTDTLLAELARLHARGARQFRFVDRTFNLKVATSLKILEFFLERIESAPHDPIFVHFELVPDHLPQALREAIARFPAGTLQFEIGIQTWNPTVQALISRRQDNDKAIENIGWLVANTGAHLHVDLIAGLPGEDLDSFGNGFDKLVALGPHEIQVGILKRLRGAPIARHQQTHRLCFNPSPPYNVLSTDRIGFADMQRIARFARYWDLYGNSGRFRQTLALLLAGQPFKRFLAFSDWVHAQTDATNRLSLERQFMFASRWLAEADGQDDPARLAALEAAIIADWSAADGRGRTGLPDSLRIAGSQLQRAGATAAPRRQDTAVRDRATPPRQARHHRSSKP
jgi:radical SAM superfamily enzyme YgiQ (UPF0313 family)